MNLAQGPRTLLAEANERPTNVIILKIRALKGISAILRHVTVCHSI
jgi:hypothetical protein